MHASGGLCAAACPAADEPAPARTPTETGRQSAWVGAIRPKEVISSQGTGCRGTQGGDKRGSCGTTRMVRSGASVLARMHARAAAWLLLLLLLLGGMPQARAVAAAVRTRRKRLRPPRPWTQQSGPPQPTLRPLPRPWPSPQRGARERPPPRGPPHPAAGTSQPCQSPPKRGESP